MLKMKTLVKTGAINVYLTMIAVCRMDIGKLQARLTEQIVMAVEIVMAFD